MDSLYTRRSIRKWEERPVEEEKVKAVLKAAMNAPSAGNQMPWEFIVVTNKEVLAKLSEVSPYAKCMANAPIAIVPIMKTEGLRFPDYDEIDSAIATENMLLAIDSLGLGGVWLGIAPLKERMDAAAKVLGLNDKKVFAFVPFGYPAMKLDANDKYDEERVTYIK